MSHSLLVVDDDPANFYVIEALLFTEGYELTALESGRETLEWLDRHPLPDLILLDVMMPDMNGIEVCQYLKRQEKTQNIPILIVTALDAKEDMAACLEAGADDFLSKPVNGVELKARVRSLLRIKEQQDALKIALENQAAIAQLREDMASMIVHDFRNPLHSILVGCELLKKTDLQPRQLRQVSNIDIAHKRLLNMTDDLLVMSKFEAGHLQLNIEGFDICTLAREIIVSWEPLAQRKTIQLDLDAPQSGTVNADANLLHRAIDNLLSNAIKFSFSETTVTVRIEADESTPDRVKICVIDCGMGVEEDVRQQIFQKYNIGTSIQGVCQLGLGLAFCKMVIEAHGGELSVSDNSPQGAIFTIALPVAVSALPVSV
ncbi:MAG: hybrid sensor histidine kinase/response regulator [Cyanobacteria bacterium SBLK]|nr:hybrid sensor histidine kinase/response regulator [Cyanobacteria bacterium SBLK]